MGPRLHHRRDQPVGSSGVEARLDLTSGPPGANLLIRVNGDWLTVTSRKGASTRGVKAAGAALLVLSGIVDLIWLNVTLLVISMLVVLCATIGAYFAVRLFKEELQISRGEVRKRWRHPWGLGWESVMQAQEVQQVSVRASDQRKDSDIALRIVGADRTIEFGADLTVPEMNWVRDCIIAVISK